MSSEAPRHNPENGPHRTECTFASENADAFALGSLDVSEVERITVHTSECPNCYDLVVDAERFAHVLAYLSPEVAPPSAHIKRQLLQAVRDESAPAAFAGTDNAVATRTPTIPASTDNPSSPVHPGTPGPEDPHMAPPVWTRFIAPALTVPLIIALVMVSMWSAQLRDEVSDLEAAMEGEQSGQPLTASAPGGEMRLFAMEQRCEDCISNGRLGINPHSAEHGVLVAWGLSPGESHGIWCVKDDGSMALIATVSVDESGDVFEPVQFPQSAMGYREIYVAKNTGGSAEYVQPELAIAMSADESDSTEVPSN